ncbi:hypothetical protein H0H81_007733 [Sphagnurus paluster]|uniref:PNPLA domain-containing protein n=1 Tax=Sphagnurus paluster TaxID=117069 RepID=A0A9P7GQM1_9AGAR|nr:hypothetical protein H0H81_007733 [Sphagnurus paluster]
MLGRLGMSVEEAIQEYLNLAKRVFSKKKWFFQDGAYKARVLESVFKEVIAKHLDGDSDELMQGSMERTSCKTFVCAVAAGNITGRTYIFRSYDVEDFVDRTYNCKIWEAARATSAAPTFFKRIYIGQEGLKEAFFDAGLGCNNPVRQLLAEARRAFGISCKIGCILSIGTGLPKVFRLKEPNLFQRCIPLSLVKVLRRIATDCERVAHDVEQEYKGIKPRVFFRLSVQRDLYKVSLDEWNRFQDVQLHTLDYTRTFLVCREIKEISELLIAGL